MNKNFYSLGLMSGTSMDGIDASIIRSDGENHLELIDDMYLKYDDLLESKLKKMVDSFRTKEDLKKLSKDFRYIEKEFTLLNVNLCKLIMKRNKNIKIDIIGFHGQTIIHNPEQGYSIQIGDSKLLSKLAKTSVVSNFRENDILNGGQGAPLTPFYHKLILLKIKSKLPSAIVNIGGISNITYITDTDKVISFDMGPGNYLIDKWVQLNSENRFDNKGLIAKSGRLNEKILKKLLKKPFYKKKYPKSLDVRDFNLTDLQDLNLADGCATLSMLTIKSICMAINNFQEIPNLILFSGGGRKNQFLIDNIKKILKIPIHLIDKFSFDGDFIESQAFAYLAIRSYLKKTISLPSTTGVKKPCSGGVVFKN